MSNETMREEALRKEVRALRGFYTHLSVYLVVNGVLAILNALTGPPWWVLWPVFGWGIALLLNALDVFILQRVLGAAWEARTMDRLAHRR